MSHPAPPAAPSRPPLAADAEAMKVRDRSTACGEFGQFSEEGVRRFGFDAGLRATLAHLEFAVFANRETQGRANAEKIRLRVLLGQVKP